MVSVDRSRCHILTDFLCLHEYIPWFLLLAIVVHLVVGMLPPHQLFLLFQVHLCIFDWEAVLMLTRWSQDSVIGMVDQSSLLTEYFGTLIGAEDSLVIWLIVVVAAVLREPPADC